MAAVAVRARHFKRIPEPQLTGPLTLTFTRTVDTPSPTAVNPSPTAQLPPSPPPPPVPPTTTSSTLNTVLPTFTPLPPTVPTTTRPVTGPPSISVLPDAPNNGTTGGNGVTQDSTSATATRKLPAGAIVGIVIGTVLIMLVIVVLLVRTRFRQNRKSKRSTWLARGGIASTAGVPPTGKTLSSFAPAEKYPSTLPPSTVPLPQGTGTYRPYPDQLTRAGDVSPGVTFARAQDKALSAYPSLSPPPATYGNNNTGISPAGPTPGSTMATPRAILPVEAATVKFTFIPSLPDELSIANGEVVKVLQEFDDGWALCANDRGQQGMVPLECLDRRDVPAPDADRLGVSTMGAPRNSARVSSMNLFPNRRSSGVLGTNL